MKSFMVQGKSVMYFVDCTIYMTTVRGVSDCTMYCITAYHWNQAGQRDLDAILGTGKCEDTVQLYGQIAIVPATACNRY